jgi:hypothetical protein
VITSFKSPSSNPTGLAFDGVYLWNADSNSDRIYKIQAESVEASRLSISGSQLSGSDVIVEASDINLADTAITGPTTFSGQASLVNTVVNKAYSPVERAFSVGRNSRVQVSWYIDATTKDLSAYPVRNAEVEVRQLFTDELVTSGNTGPDGKVRLTALAETITLELAEFIGNYKVLAKYWYLGKEYVSEPKGIALKKNETMAITLPLRYDRTPPSIERPVINPQVIFYNTTVTISSKVTDTESGVTEVTLGYRKDSGEWVPMVMPISGLLTYVATIPPQPEGTAIALYVEASDVIGNKAVNDNNGKYYTYKVAVPETALAGVIVLCMVGLRRVGRDHNRHRSQVRCRL